MTDGPVPLREHLEALLAAQATLTDQRFRDSQRATEAALAAAEKAVAAALAAAEKAVEAALGAVDKATRKAEAADEHRFALLNEWRTTYEKLTAGYPTRTEVNLRMDAMAKDIAEIKQALAGTGGERRGVARSFTNVQMALGMLGAVIGIGAVVVAIALAISGRNP